MVLDMVLPRIYECVGRLLSVLLLAAMICLWLPDIAGAAMIRVCLQSGAASAEFTVSEGEYEVRGGSLAASTVCIAEEGDEIRIVLNGSRGVIYLNDEKAGSASNDVSLLAVGEDDNIIKFGKTEYRGSMAVLQSGYVLNILDIEQYLYGVVGREIGYDVPEEALRAQAVVARSYAAFSLGGKYYDVSASTASQVYGGYTAETDRGGERIIAAVDDTAHQVMYYDGEPVEAVFCSSAGGHTEDNENVWGGIALPYLRGVPSPYDEGKHSMDWQVSFTPDELADLAVSYMKRTGKSGSFGSFVRLELSYEAADGGDTVSGRVTEAAIIGSGCTVRAQRDSIRTLLGLKSTLFEITDAVETPAYDEVYVLNAAGNLVRRPWGELVAVGGDGVVQTLGELTEAYMRDAAGMYSLCGGGQTGGVTITGSGWGHGVGMSQNGAIGMAEDGYGAEDILRHYYGGEDEDLLTIRDMD